MENTQDPKEDFHGIVDTLLRAAFETGDEADLVTRLLADKDMAGELVVRGKARILGYAGLSRMVSPKGWLCLAPVAVDPDAQGVGHGSTLMKMVLKWAEERDAVVVVLGNPEYYEAQGFSRARAAKLKTRYPNEFTLLAGLGTDVPEEKLVYPPAFDGMD